MLNYDRCLNGYWDINPIFGDSVQNEIPSSGWISDTYTAPSFWNSLLDGVRKKGEKYYRETSIAKLKENQTNLEEMEFLFDNFNYPKQWSLTRRAWFRKFIDIGKTTQDELVFIRFNGILPSADLYVNGEKLSHNIDQFIPWETDITKFLKKGKNEIAVFIDDYQHTPNGKITVPAGNWIGVQGCGIYQDVYLLKKKNVYIDDLCIRTYVSENKLYAAWTLKNTTDKDASITLNPEVLKWAKNKIFSPLLKFEAFNVTVPANSSVKIEREFKNVSLPLWNPEAPNLCILRTSLSNGASHDERFGFRELKVEGPSILLNGYPIHLFSDWGHKCTLLHHHEQWIRQWFQMIKDLNMNHSRLHTHPHPELILDIADEEGILITAESANHGSGNALGTDSPEFWKNSAEHIKKFVKRDKNHPCIVLWSVENEMRWNQPNILQACVENLPNLRKLFNELDPTRVAYHEGDSSLWDESKLEITSRHYGKCCSGTGWWDRKNVLHAGEMSLYHHDGPEITCQLGGDSVWTDYKKVLEAGTIDTRWIVEEGRTMGVSCFGPWNMSCLQNFRHSDSHTFTYKKLDVPGVKPLIVPPYSSEFMFWQKSIKNAYIPSAGFEIQKAAFRPFALIDKSRRNSYYSNAQISREIFCVNDLPREVKGCLEVKFANKSIGTYSLSIPRGEVKSVKIKFNAPLLKKEALKKFSCSFKDENGKILDKQDTSFIIGIIPSLKKLRTHIKFFGNGASAPIWQKMGINAEYIQTLNSDSLKNTDIIIIESESVNPGSDMNKVIKTFCENGGRCLILEQNTSIFNFTKLPNVPVLKVWKRSPNHPVLKNISDDELGFWSDAPYTYTSDLSAIAKSSYKKASGLNAISIIDGGGAGDDFSAGKEMDRSHLIEFPCGKGTVIASQLLLQAKFDSIPAASKLLADILKYLDSYKARTYSELIDDDSMPLSEKIAAAKSGKTVFVNCKNSSELKLINDLLGLKLETVTEEDGTYQFIKADKDSYLFDGINNEDACGILARVYNPKENFKLAELLFKHDKNIDPIFVTSTQSALKEMFVMNGCTEPLRAHTLSRFLFNEKPQSFVGAGIVKAGNGRVILWQINTDCKDVRFERLKNTLKINLGADIMLPSLDGQIEAGGHSSGFPDAMNISPLEFDDATFEKLRAVTSFSPEMIVKTAATGIVEWGAKGRSPEGRFIAPHSGKVSMFISLMSPVKRKGFDDLLGVPNPGAMTSLCVEGSGTLELFVNSNLRDRIELTESEKSIRDIYLEQGFNNILMRWTVKKAGETIKMRWKNINGAPETDFKFSTGR